MAAYPNPFYPQYGIYNPQEAAQTQQYMPRNMGLPQYNQQALQQPTAAPQAISPSSRPVSNKDEANATPVDLSGALMLFPDLKNNCIYLKRLNTLTGTADFWEFEGKNYDRQSDADGPVFATLQDIDNVKDIIDNLRDEIDKLKKSTGKTVKKNEPADE